jgi:hypothetical protein
MMTDLRREVTSLKAAVDDMKLTLNQHANLLRCSAYGGGRNMAAKHEISRPLSDAKMALNQHTNLLLRMAYETVAEQEVSCPTMLSRREILEDYNSKWRGCYEAEGAFRLAAANAFVFFDDAHKLMRPRLVDGVLYARKGCEPVMAVSGRVPDMTAGVSPLMVPFKLDEGCIWVRDESACEVMNADGASHRVTLVHTLEGDCVVVDWGIGQFEPLHKDVRLYIRHDDLAAM